MPLCNPAELKPLLPTGTRLLGLDVGTKTIGMALSDTTHIIATPLDTIRRTRFRDDLKRLLDHLSHSRRSIFD
jgi:putative holliday junction resolvase